MKRMVWLLAALCAAVAVGLYALTPRSEEQTLTFEGLGPIRTGMTVPEAEAALGAKLLPMDTSNGVSSEDCWYTRRADGIDATLAYMISNGRIVRIDVDDSGPNVVNIDPMVVTEHGIRIGSSEQELKAAYDPRLVISTHPHSEEPDHYARVFTDNKTHGLLFEIWGGTVSAFRTGTSAAIELPEGCV